MKRAVSILILSLASVTSLLAATIAFLAPPASPLGDYDMSTAMVAADFNRDGRDDVAVSVGTTDGRAVGLKIMLADESGVLQPGMSIPNGLAAVAAEIVEVDIAKDPDAAQRSIIDAFARVVHANDRHVSLDDHDE